MVPPAIFATRSLPICSNTSCYRLDPANAWASLEMITSEMAIKQQLFSLCSRHVESITGRKALTMREVIALHIGGAVTT